jgi:heat shock protein HtpX
MSNSLKVWGLLIFVSIFLLFGGYHVGDRQGLLIGFLLALSINVIVMIFGDTRLLKQIHAVQVEGRDAWGVFPVVQKMAQKAHIPTPSVYIIPTHHPTAFSLGMSWFRAVIGVSVGLIRQLSAEELEAVIAHQVAQIKNLDTFTFGIASTIANALLGLGRWLDRLFLTRIFFGARLLRPFSRMMIPIARTLIRLTVNPSTYYLNDSLAASLVERPEVLAEALWKLESQASTHPFKVPMCSEHLFIVNPFPAHTRLGAHPPAEDRIRRLIGYFPM